MILSKTKACFYEVVALTKQVMTQQWIWDALWRGSSTHQSRFAEYLGFGLEISVWYNQKKI